MEADQREAIRRRRMSGTDLTEENVRDLRRAIREGRMTKREAADFYGKGIETIRRICNGASFSWVKDAPEPTAEVREAIDQAAAASAARLMRLLDAQPPNEVE